MHKFELKNDKLNFYFENGYGIQVDTIDRSGTIITEFNGEYQQVPGTFKFFCDDLKDITRIVEQYSNMTENEINYHFKSNLAGLSFEGAQELINAVGKYNFDANGNLNPPSGGVFINDSQEHNHCLVIKYTGDSEFTDPSWEIKIKSFEPNHSTPYFETESYSTNNEETIKQLASMISQYTENEKLSPLQQAEIEEKTAKIVEETYLENLGPVID